jgi:hypothetical protein
MTRKEEILNQASELILINGLNSYESADKLFENRDKKTFNRDVAERITYQTYWDISKKVILDNGLERE